jgi:alpha-L-fucosidase
LIGDKEATVLTEFKKLRDQSFDENLLQSANIYYQFSPKNITFRTVDSSGAFGANLQSFVVELPEKTKMNCIVLREAIHLGQTIRKFNVVFYRENKMIGEINGTSVGRKRILTFPAKNITSFRINLEDARGEDNISGVTAYLIEERLVEK